MLFFQISAANQSSANTMVPSQPNIYLTCLQLAQPPIAPDFHSWHLTMLTGIILSYLQVKY